MSYGYDDIVSAYADQVSRHSCMVVCFVQSTESVIELGHHIVYVSHTAQRQGVAKIDAAPAPHAQGPAVSGISSDISCRMLCCSQRANLNYS